MMLADMANCVVTLSFFLSFLGGDDPLFLQISVDQR